MWRRRKPANWSDGACAAEPKREELPRALWKNTQALTKPLRSSNKFEGLMSLALGQTDPSQDTVLECATVASTLYAESRDSFIN
mmetsp:Transcript_25263/g.66223  ORF Transcript_25263/g.66223 Transcript_25263/m.66223 type:complete len:84 (-) Transcript_25263:66-317(-)